MRPDKWAQVPSVELLFLLENALKLNFEALLTNWKFEPSPRPYIHMLGIQNIRFYCNVGSALKVQTTQQQMNIVSSHNTMNTWLANNVIMRIDGTNLQ